MVLNNRFMATGPFESVHENEEAEQAAALETRIIGGPFSGEPQPQASTGEREALWSAVTCHRFAAEPTCRRGGGKSFVRLHASHWSGFVREYSLYRRQASTA